MLFFNKKRQSHPNESSHNESSYRDEQVRPLTWVVPQKLSIGSLPTSADHARLLNAKIQVIFSLCAAVEGELPPVIQQDFECISMPLPDSHYDQPLRVEQLAAAVEQLHQLLNQNRTTYIHCLVAIERSPTVCISYLNLYQNMEVWAALNWLKQIHPRTCPTTAQIQVIRKLSESKKNRGFLN